MSAGWEKSLRAANKDLSILVDDWLDFSQQYALTGQKVNHILGSIKNSVARRLRDVSLLIYPHETPPGVLNLHLWCPRPKKSMDLLE